MLYDRFVLQVNLSNIFFFLSLPYDFKKKHFSLAYLNSLNCYSST